MFTKYSPHLECSKLSLTGETNYCILLLNITAKATSLKPLQNKHSSDVKFRRVAKNIYNLMTQHIAESENNMSRSRHRDTRNAGEQ